MPAYHRNDGNAVSKDVTVPGDVEKNRIFGFRCMWISDFFTYIKKLSGKIIGVRAIFCRGWGGGGGKPFAQKILGSCPNFYETVEKKRGPYDVIM